MAISDVEHPLTKEIFHELAAATWRHLQGADTDLPKMPTRSDLESALKNGELDDAIPEFNERSGAALAATASDPDMPVINVGKPFTPMVVPGLDMMKIMDKTPAEIMRFFVAASFDTQHDLWCEAKKVNQKLKHPIAPFIESWFNLPVQIEPSKKRAGILPISMESAGALEYMPDFAPKEAPLGNQEGMGMLPGFAPVESTIIPGVLVQTWAAGGGKMVNSGRGAPVPLRIWFGLLTSIPYEARRVPGRKRITMTLRDLRDLIYFIPEGKRHHFNPKRDIARLRGDLWEVDQIRIRTILPGYKAPGLWRPVGVTLMPEADLDSPIIFDVELPPGSVGGAMIDRSAMRYFGVKSPPQYAAAIGLPYYWDKFGTHRKGTKPIQATRPTVLRNKEGLALGADSQVLLDQRDQPVAGFNDDRIVFMDASKRPTQGRTLAERRRLAARERNPYADRYPILLDNDMLMLCYPADATELTGNLRYQRLNRAKEAIQAMEEVGYCISEPAEGEFGEQGYRILPTDWSSFSQA